MPVLTVTAALQDVKKLKTDAVIVGFTEDTRPLSGLAGELDWLLCGALSSLIITDKLRGSLRETALITSRDKVPAPKIFLIGLGPLARITAASLNSAAEAAVTAAVDAGVRDMALECVSVPQLSPEVALQALTQGAVAGTRKRQARVQLLAPDAARYELLTRILRDPSRTDLPMAAASLLTDTRRP